MNKKYRQIGDTPLSISVYSVEKTATTMHGAGYLEIIFCLKGSVRFSYAYEEFTINAGQFISIDRDAYYLYDGKDNLCVSFLLDLSRYKDEYPDIGEIMFVCEGCPESDMPYPTADHNLLKGMMIAILKHLRDGGEEELVASTLKRIIELFMDRFDICYYHARELDVTADVLKNIRKVTTHMQMHMKEKVTIKDLAELLSFTESYMSEYMRKYSIGFRDLLQYIRANESERLLIQTNKTILQISEECGFSDVKYYHSAFKRWYKQTPRQFREQFRKPPEEVITYMDIEDIGDILDEWMTKHYMETFLG